ncbi:hypothetical protein [Tuwongella immobilis]|uniref:DUF4380 domain-containing protein n=1 Tax=Tuwongella immobilis TaxID=692036 RepID=A0A6C2YIZ8_9BACT|nr:hypothetical protein [Tuwongella immobilis]VIP01219.1 Uncharacterized protein OS=Singulisphaera acidiphila (strain ATCC BAA-1392 / DSM 18658 / VKM B-2454 / MOB10) GN=Sinac_1246 PE=4 SV=1: DUF4380 [Tuwongella immobilis]VTR97864.1 Uncharacterized protein OS=Singulisphaera acidiphila (strain ATCC BAA-1392 / DSM 18658 / VKM B-2454 / MOB10) GN=Sinac_1246 PE=4 SV=1: DUF4380 [Tuwongella immobilis]
MEIVPYHGWANNLRLSNGQVELIVTLDVGPRVIAYRLLPDGKNVMKNYTEMLGGRGEPEWQIRGGSRFWLGPEDLTRTYYPDNNPVTYQEIAPGAVRFVPPPETEYGVQKEMEIYLSPTGSQVKLHLRVTNIGSEPTTLCPWGPTVMAPGGVEIIPLPEKFPHPGHPSRAKSPADYAPNQQVAFWPYFDFSDSRFSFGRKYIQLRQDPTKGPTKIGLAHRLGWVAYLNEGTLFVMRFGYEEGANYPDNGGNYQSFSNEDMLEMEPIGPISTLEPGRYAELTMSWELHSNVPAVHTEAEIDAVILPLIHRN